jgi:hypothetical protein
MKNQNSVIEKIKAELAAFEKKKQAFVTELRKEFPTMFTELFAQAPKLKSVSWTQYTPYFNDGDTCEFSANTDDLYVNGRHPDYDEDDELVDDEISINPVIFVKLKTIEDVRINKELCEKTRRSWYAKAGIGETGWAPNPKYDADADRVCSEISTVLSSIPSEFLKDLFGDHAKVTICSNGTIDVEDYDHD